MDRHTRRYAHLRRWFAIVAALSGFALCGAWSVHRANYRFAQNQALAEALRRNDIAAARRLIYAGADPDTRENPEPLPRPRSLIAWVRSLLSPHHRLAGTGKTALILASGCGDECLVKDLLDGGADVNARDEDGETALLAASHLAFVAREYGEEERWREEAHRLPVYDVMKLLLDHGTDVNAQDMDGSTVLQCVPELHNAACERLALSHGADVKLRDRFGLSGLYNAASEDRLDLVREELRRGADPNEVQLRHYDTALMAAAETGDVELVRLLLDHGANVNAEDDGQEFGTALITAVRHRASEDMIRLLLARGARWEPKDCQGKTALDWAKLNPGTPAATLLKQAGAR